MRFRVFGPLLLATSFASGVSLTGITAFYADSTGAFAGVTWNTVGGDAVPNFYVQVNGSSINSGNGPSTSVNVLLGPGVTSYSGYGDGLLPNFFGTALYFGMSLFMDGNTTSPAFTFFWPNPATAPVLPTTALTPNMVGGLVPGGGGGPYVSGNETVTILSVPVWNGPFGKDDLSAFNNVPGDCPTDFCGVPAALLVTATPEPETLVLIVPAVGLLAWFRRRYPSSKERPRS